MRRQIWKYPLPKGLNLLEMPEKAIPRSVQIQGGQLCLWAEVQTNQPLEKRRFIVIGTGHPFPPVETRPDIYIGTVQDGALVWHIYESVIR
jgi:hypothetical protein